MEEGEPRDDCGCWECRPQVFTSVLLGILSCVLVTGGVFLAFHKWDHTWLLVSAVGVVLIVIGTILHCCSSSHDESQQRNSNGHKGRPHVIPCGDNGTLTEQLLPLSNARSVSQLSLNMVPSYFPAYSIEQHSAVVHNINRIVQGTGRSFLLLPIPADASPTQLQNLMASVCQLDGSVSAEESSSSRDPPATELSSQTTTDMSVSQSTETLQEQPSLTSSSDLPALSTQTSSLVRIVKHAEVQTCCDWQVQRNCAASSTSDVRTLPSDSTTIGNDAQSQTPMLEESREMPVCLTLPDNATADEDAEVAGSTEDITVVHDVVDVVSEASMACNNNSTEPSEPLASCDIPITTDAACESLPISIMGELVDVSPSQPCVPVPQVVVATEVSEDSSLLDVIAVQTTSAAELAIQPVVDSSISVLQTSELTSTQNLSEHELLGADACSSVSDQLDSATETEDCESIGRSSPPPSYDDVTQENQTIIGAFGLAYGTI